MKMKDYKGYCFKTESEYRKFEGTCIKELKKRCGENGYKLSHFYKNHYEWSAVIEKDGKHLYIRIQDVRFFKNWMEEILIRGMKDSGDWIGEENHTTTWKKIFETAEEIKKTIR